MSDKAPDKEWNFSGYSDKQLVQRFNGDVGNAGWVGARGRFHHALFSEFKKRGIDFSCIQSDNSISLARKVKLVGKKLELKAGQKAGRGGSIIFITPID
jgi:hypothetical protein